MGNKIVIPREKHYQSALMDVLCRRPDIRIWRQNVGTVLTGTRVFRAGPPPGVGDLSGIVIRHGWRIEIEVKTKSKRTHAQECWADFIVRSGGIYIYAWWDPKVDMAANVRRVGAELTDRIEMRCALI